MRTMRLLAVLFVVFWSAISLAQTDTPYLQGMIVEEGSLKPISGVRIQLSGPGTHDVLSDAFGYFKFTELATGQWTVTLTHQAYQQKSVTVSVTAGGRHRLDTTLQLKSGFDKHFPLDLQVYDVNSNVLLPDAKVTVHYWDSSPGSSDPPTSTFTVVTKLRGQASFVGLKPGWYRIVVERTGWETYSHPSATGSVSLDSAHSAIAGLKPKYATLKVTVKGVDPVELPDKPDPLALSGVVVEIVGIEFDTEREMTPPRATTTNKENPPYAGFNKLSPIRYKVEVKKPGYETKTVIVTPNAAGTFDDLVIDDFALKPTKLKLLLDSPYVIKEILKGASVWLEGVKGTNTEGISRFLAGDIDNDGKLSVTFDQLLPGRFWIKVAHKAQVSPPIHGVPTKSGPIDPPVHAGVFNVDFVPHQGFVEVAGGESRQLDLFLEPVKAVVKAQILLFGKLRLKRDNDTQIVKRQKISGVTFVEHKGMAILKPEFQSVSFDTDDDGRFVARIYPSRYGVKIESMADYMGVNWKISATTAQLGLPRTVGWPYAEVWPHARHWPWLHSAWTAFNSGVEYGVTMQLAKREINLSIAIRAKDDFGGIIMQNQALFQDPTGSIMLNFAGKQHFIGPQHTVTLDGTAGTYSSVFGSHEKGGQVFTGVVFEGVKPGTYTLKATHPFFSFQDKTITINDWPAPGVLPAEVYELNTDKFLQSGMHHQHYYIPTDDDSTKTDSAWIGTYKSQLDSNPRKHITIMNCVWHSPAVTGGEGYYLHNNQTPYFVSKEPGLENMLFIDSAFVRPTGEHDVYTYVGTKVGNSDVKRWHKFSPSQVDNSGNACCPQSSPNVPNEPNCLSGPKHTDFDYYVVFVDGPRSDINDTKPPMLPSDFQVLVKTFNAVDDEIPGLPITVGVGNDLLSGGTFTANDLNDLGGLKINSPEWTQTGNLSQFVISPYEGPGKPLIFGINMRIKRAMVLEGVVKLPDDSPAAGVKIELLNRTGSEHKESKDISTGLDGTFQFGNLTPEVVYIEVRHPGYKPVRLRLKASDPLKPDIKDIAITLEPLPQVELATFSIDRYGFFLPGVTKMGDRTGFDPDVAKPKLTATWKVKEKDRSYQVTRPSFEDDKGTFNPAETVTLDDPVMEIWLVDKRFFRQPSTNRDPGVEPETLPKPSPLTATNTKKWLMEMVRGQSDLVQPGEYFNVVHQIGIFSADGSGAGGTLKLWRLPEGDFVPWAVVFTRGGAVELIDYKDFLPSGKIALKGLRIPKWGTRMLNLMGTLGNSPLLDPKKAVPKGKIMPLGGFNATIGLNEQTGYLTYDYRMTVSWHEGQKNSKGGLFGLGAKLFGFMVPAEFGFKLEGEKDRVSLTGRVLLTKEATDLFFKEEELDTPSIADKKPKKLITPKISWTASGGLSVVQQYDENSPWADWRLKAFLIGALEVDVKIDLLPFLGKLPYVGPALKFAEKTAGLGLFGVFNFGIGGEINSEFSTRFPIPGAGSLVSTPPANLHAFGGKEDDILPPINFDKVFWKAGVGLEIEAFGGKAKGRGLIQIGSPNDVIVPLGGVVMKVNQDGWWPPITRITGAASISLKVLVELWGVSISKAWQWDLKRFDWQLTTEPYFELTKSNESLTVLTPKTATPSSWTNSGNTLVTNFYPAGPVAKAANGNALVYTGTEPKTGGTPIYVSLNGANGFQTPVKVADPENAVLSTAILALDDGGFLLVWSERNDPLNVAVPKTRIVWSISNADGSDWSEPKVAYELDATAHGLQLAAGGKSVFLTWFLNREGPQSDVQSLWMGLFQGGGWSAGGSEWHPTAELTGARLIGSTANNGPKTGLALRKANGDILWWSYDGSNWTSQQTIVEQTTRGFALTVDDGGDFWLAAGEKEGGLTLYRRPASSNKPTADSSFVVVVELLELNPGEIALHAWPPGNEGPIVLISWIERGDKNTIWATYVGSDGSEKRAPFNVTPGNSGTLSKLQLLPLEGSGLPARVVAQSNADDGIHLKQWEFDLTSTPVALDPGDSDTTGGGDVVDATLGGSSCKCTFADQPTPIGGALLLLLLFALLLSTRRRKQNAAR